MHALELATESLDDDNKTVRLSSHHEAPRFEHRLIDFAFRGLGWRYRFRVGIVGARLCCSSRRLCHWIHAPPLRSFHAQQTCYPNVIGGRLPTFIRQVRISFPQIISNFSLERRFPTSLTKPSFYPFFLVRDCYGASVLDYALLLGILPSTWQRQRNMATIDVYDFATVLLAMFAFTCSEFNCLGFI